MKKLKTILYVVILLTTLSVRSQVSISTDGSSPDGNAMLEVKSSNKGLLLPRLSLSSTTSPSPLTAHVAGMVVYNTATVGDVTPGYYSNDGTSWIRLATGSGGITTLGTATNATDGKGATVSGSTLTLGLATDTYPGLVSTTTQTLSGSKSITAVADPLKLTGGVGTQTATVAYSNLVIDNASGAIRKAPVINKLSDVIENTVGTPPGSPASGDAYLVPVSPVPTGAWAGLSNQIATWNGSSWTMYSPANNDQTSVQTGANAGKVYVYSTGTSSWTQTTVLSGTSLSDITAAKAVNTLDNTNYAQTWNWSTASTQNPLSITAGTSLSTGKLLTLSTASTALTTAGANTGSLLNVEASGANTAFTGALSEIKLSNATGNAGNTGTLLDILDNASTLNNVKLLNLSSASTGATQVMKLTSASTASFGSATGNGGVNFNFTGNHTGSGVQIDDITTAGAAQTINATGVYTGTGGLWNLNANSATTGTVASINANGLTSGKALSIVSTGTTTTGNLLWVSSASAGSFGTSLGGVSFNFTGAHSGNGVQINDATNTGNGMSVYTNSLTNGYALNISSNSTGLNNGRLLRVYTNGVNAAAATTTTAAEINNSRTNTTSGTNVGLSVSASGGATANYALLVPAGDVGIGTSTPVATAALDVTSTTKGLLPPRMTNAQMLAITPSSTNNGMVVYATTANATTGSPIGLYTVNNSNGTYAWEYIGSKQMVFNAISTSQTLATNSAGTAYTVDATSGNIVLTLPDITTANKGQSIEITRTDNSGTYSVQVSAATGENISGTSSMYLYSQNESVTLRNDGTSTWRIVASNRQGVANATKSFLSATLTAAQTTNVAAGSHIKFNDAATSFGSDITLDETTAYSSTNNAASVGRFTLKANKTYHLTGHGFYSGSSNDNAFQWYNATTGTALGKSSMNSVINENQAYGVNTTVETIFTPTVDTKVEIRMSQVVTQIYPEWQAYIEVLSDLPANAPTDAAKSQVYGTIDYVHATFTTTQSTNVAANDHLKFQNATVTGNLPFDVSTTYTTTANAASMGRVTLKAGKTYRLTGSPGYVVGSTAATYISFQWYDATNSIFIGNKGDIEVYTNTANMGYSTVATAIYTPATDVLVELRLNSTSGTVTELGLTTRGTGFAEITQIGTSAYTESVWQSYTPDLISESTLGAAGGVMSVTKASYKVVGKSLHINCYLKFSTVPTAAGAYSISLPPGYSIDYTNITKTAGTACSTGNGAGLDASMLGPSYLTSNSSHSVSGFVVAANSVDRIALYHGSGVNVASFAYQNTLWGYNTIANGGSVRFTAEIPIE
jgi:trimeric autotransporter adhesin